MTDPLVNTHRSHINTLALAARPNFPDLFRRAGDDANRFLRRTKLDLVINLKTAKALGLTIPPPLRLRVDQMIE